MDDTCDPTMRHLFFLLRLPDSQKRKLGRVMLLPKSIKPHFTAKSRIEQSLSAKTRKAPVGACHGSDYAVSTGDIPAPDYTLAGIPRPHWFVAGHLRVFHPGV